MSQHTAVIVTAASTRRPRGFAAMKARAAQLRVLGQHTEARALEEQISAIARRGGQAAHAQGTAHRWDSAQAAVAGRRGGQARRTRGAGAAA